MPDFAAGHICQCLKAYIPENSLLTLLENIVNHGARLAESYQPRYVFHPGLVVKLFILQVEAYLTAEVHAEVDALFRLKHGKVHISAMIVDESAEGVEECGILPVVVLVEQMHGEVDGHVTLFHVYPNQFLTYHFIYGVKP